MGWVLFWSSHYRQGYWASERLSHLLRVTQLLSEGAKIWSPDHTCSLAALPALSHTAEPPVTESQTANTGRTQPRHLILCIRPKAIHKLAVTQGPQPRLLSSKSAFSTDHLPPFLLLCSLSLPPSLFPPVKHQSFFPQQIRLIGGHVTCAYLTWFEACLDSTFISWVNAGVLCTTIMFMFTLKMM